jgi:WD40 repeat protein
VLRNPSQFVAVSLSGDGKLLATAGFGAVHLWRIDKPESPFHSFPQDFDNLGPTTASFNPNGQFVMTTSGMVGTARVWRLDQLETPIAEWTDQSGGIIAASFTSDGKFIATASDGGKIQQWRLDQLGRNHKPVFQADIKTQIGSASFSPDGKRLLIPRQLKTADLQSAAHLVNLDNPETWEDKPTTNVVFYTLGAAALSADGKLVAAAADGGTVRVWRVDKTYSPFAVLHGHEGPVYAASFSLDGKFIATAGADRTTRIWRVDQPMAIANPDQSSNWTTRLDELIQLAGNTAGRNLTSEEWLQFFPDEEYHSTFPDLPAHKIEKQE